MKSSKKAQTIISIILILAVIVLGIFAFLASKATITSKVKLIILDGNVLVKVKGEAKWVQGGNNVFETQSTSEGLIDDEWTLPDVTWTSVDEPSELKFTITNLNINDNSNLNFMINGVKYDDESERFITTFAYQINEASITPATQVTKNNSLQTFTIPSTTNSVTIYLNYYLKKVNESFNIAQDINISITQEQIND